VVFENGLDDRPGGLDGVLASEQRPVTRQSVCEEAFAGLLLVRLRVEQRELTLVAGELLARPLDPGREGDNRVGREPETQIVGAALCRRGVGETYLLMFHRPRAQA
jgi:hypothetical protein